ncbi:Predicted arabinose efflux permease, MFS family [Modicisalibacter ilicicola DSM 19980]|uniref:Predicted arabinose efflux permease, MFS family n=1 Tax=Modicisalibacter ilicicola DSM 19980 TaxID=1121942 RepID=A0A1M5EFA6_9GAMM|nr:MFS transporter [Halomonas ilicicola]SHF77908.1 Predicted arabinose efflux permease, MFS family [Halomonas ilicicola DSM 19980]
MGYRTLARDHRGLLGIGLLAMLSSSLGQSYFVGLFQAPIAERLAISAGEFGIAYSIVTLIAGFVVLYCGPSVDWIAPRRFAILVLSGMLGGILLLTLSPWALSTLLGLGLVRLCGQGLFTHLGNTLIGREFTHSRGRALGLVSLGIPLGEILLPPLVTALLVWLAWRELWWCLGMGLALLWGMMLWRMHWPKAPGERPNRAARRSGPRPLREARFWLLLPLLMALPITMTGLFIYAPQLTADLDATMTAYALALTGMGLAKLPGALLGGRWADLMGPALLARTYLLPYALALLMAMGLGGNLGVWALMIGGGLAIGMQEIIATSLLVQLWGSEHLGRVRATLSACMVFSTGIAPAVLGVLVDAGLDFRLILAGMLAFILIGWLLAQQPIAEARRTGLS